VARAQHPAVPNTVHACIPEAVSCKIRQLIWR